MQQQVENITNPQETENKEIEKLDNALAVNRFIWLRNIDPVYDNNFKWKISLEYDHEIKQYIKSMVTADPNSLSNVLRKSAQSKCTDEILWCLAFCLREVKNEAASVELRKNFLELVPSSENLLFFMKNFNKLSFSAGIRNCLSKWYEKKSPDELIEIIFGLGKFEKLSHGEIVRKLHPKSENAEKQEVFAAAYKDYNQISEAAKTSTTLKKILVLKDLKRCQNVAEVVEILKKNEVNFKLHHIPTFAVKTPEAIELILPNLTISELISSLPVFAERKLLKDSTAKKISSSLQCSAKIINEAKLNPVKIFEVIRKLSGPEIPVVKKEETVETEKKEKRVMYPQIVQKLRNIFNQSLSEQPKTGCRFFITLDVRKFSKRQSDVVGMRNVTCPEIQTIVALALLKTEKDVTLMSFTDDRNKLKPIPWTRETSYEKAMEIYEKEITEKPKTKENISLPLKKATEEKKPVDVFVTFVSSVGRTMGKNAKPPMEALQSYQKAMNLNKARLIVINLTRKKSDFKFDVKSKGILEIVGFGPDSMNVIEAFAKNCFY